MRIVAPFLALVLLLAPGAQAGDIPLGQPFTLAPGEIVHVGNLPIIVQFDSILSDSRCPSDAVCVWEGEATAQLKLSTPRGATASVDLHTRFSPFGPAHAEFAEHVVRLREVSPYPVMREPIDPGEYRVELVVEAAVTLPTDVTSWSSLKGSFR